MQDLFNDIWDAIVEKIQDTIDGGNSRISKVYQDYREDIEGYPAVCVIPSENESDYNSTTDDKVNFVYKLVIYYPLPKEGEISDSGKALGRALGEMLQLFKARNSLGSACDWVFPAPSSWGFEQRGETTFRTAEVTLRCRKMV